MDPIAHPVAARLSRASCATAANLVITIGVAPLLALLIATILRYSDSGRYDFASAYHIPTFLFLTLIVAMFLGLTNSADDIIRDRAVLQRERNLNVRLTYYVFAKTISLGVFALVQCILFVLIGNYILEIRGMFWSYLAIVFMTAMSGVSLGLVVSALVADPKTAANIVPLVLIPQIIMGGAMIKYEDMNRNLGLVYTFSRWFHEHPDSDETKQNGQPSAGAIYLRICRDALVLRRAGRSPGETESRSRNARTTRKRRSTPSSPAMSHIPAIQNGSTT